jgi:hypothetical protein
MEEYSRPAGCPKEFDPRHEVCERCDLERKKECATETSLMRGADPEAAAKFMKDIHDAAQKLKSDDEEQERESPYDLDYHEENLRRYAKFLLMLQQCMGVHFDKAFTEDNLHKFASLYMRWFPSFEDFQHKPKGEGDDGKPTAEGSDA